MANDKFLNYTGLEYYHDRTEAKNAATYATKTALDTLEDKVDEIIAEGGEPNVIETVKVNGTALTPVNKAVDVEVPTTVAELSDSSDYALTTDVPTDAEIEALADGRIADSISSSATSSIASKQYVADNGGKIDTIKVNGTTQTITNKAVDITVPTKTSDITNDSDYQNETEVQALIDAALEDITGIEFEVVQTLPASGVKGTIYLVPNSGSSPNTYDEYIWLTPSGGTARWEKIGTTDVDLSGYWAKTELTAITTAEIDTIIA